MPDTYDKAVTEARSLVKRSEADQWRLAELTWEQVEAGKSRRQWAKDIGIGTTHASNLYLVWVSVQKLDTKPPFTEAYNAVGGKPYQLTKERGAAEGFAALPSERKAEVVREAILHDSEVAVAAASANLERKLARQGQEDGNGHQDVSRDPHIKEAIKNRLAQNTTYVWTVASQHMDAVMEFQAKDVAQDMAAEGEAGIRQYLYEVERLRDYLAVLHEALTAKAEKVLEVVR